MSDSPSLTHNQVSTEDLCEVIITAPDASWLAEFVRELITARLCAGSHLAEVRSLYPWHGEVHDTAEARVALRTRTVLVPHIIARTRAVHPYEIPSVIAIPIIAANPDYAAWIRSSTERQASTGSP